MANLPYQHTPVMVKEVVEALRPKSGVVIVDCTVGGGGHAQALLKSGASVIGIDQDQDIPRLEKIKYIHGNFGDINGLIKRPVDGFLFDLGVSSYQIDEPTRGFSLQKDGPLDMRMDKTLTLTAEDILNTWDQKALEDLIRQYGEERFAGRIARKIKENRITTTGELKEIIEKAIPTWKKRESVTRVFQALRIAVNSELEKLEKALKDAVELLKPKGRIAVISYHSLEDRIVKHAFRAFAKDGKLKLLTKKPVTASIEEISSNPRARSAKLRAAEKT